MRHNQSGTHIPERFLRQLWKHHLFHSTDLATVEGLPVEILSAGTLNNDGGPDFTNARVRIDGIIYAGDVELHRDMKEWLQHAHHLDRKYNGVILHVVLRADCAEPQRTHSNRVIHVLALDRYLTGPLRESWHEMIMNERAERLATIRCCSVNDTVEPSYLREWLEKVGMERMEMKIRRFEERLKELVDERRNVVMEPASGYAEVPYGVNPEDLPPPGPSYTQRDFATASVWEQLLFEGICLGLGYSKNQESLTRLAQNVRLSALIPDMKVMGGTGAEIRVEGILFGAAGLLPSPRTLNERESRCYVRRLRREWKEFKRAYHGEVLDPAAWQFFRLRPENFPTRRIAAAARVALRLRTSGMFRAVISTVRDACREPARSFGELEAMMTIPADGVWKDHYRFEERSPHVTGTLIGRQRAGDIVLNVLLPISFLYARIFKIREVRDGAMALYRSARHVPDNSITRIMESQLLKKRISLDSPLFQQGALQLYKMYCVEERCGECAIGRALGVEVGGWGVRGLGQN